MRGSSEDQWWRIGCMILELPGDEGLNLWREWSLRDEEYRTTGKTATRAALVGKPALKRWSWDGSLIKLADHYDPDRKRFLKNPAVEQTINEVNQTPISYKLATLSFEEVIEKAKSYLELDNPAEMNFNLNNLALQAGYRDQVALEKLIVDQIQYEGAEGLMTIQELAKLDTHREFLIPDVLPHPSVVLIYGAGGDGKSMSAWTLAKHVATGAPFVVRGKHVPVQQGPVLLLNGDQPLVQLKEQLEEVDYPLDSNTHIQTDWALQRYAQFVKLMNDIKPKLVVIDSLIGCSGGRAFDENKSDFATPLYWLTRNNGVLFRNNDLGCPPRQQAGGFGPAIRDAVDETGSRSPRRIRRRASHQNTHGYLEKSWSVRYFAGDADGGRPQLLHLRLLLRLIRATAHQAALPTSSAAVASDLSTDSNQERSEWRSDRRRESCGDSEIAPAVGQTRSHHGDQSQCCFW